MFDKLRQWFTQNAVEIPEELSVCVFECGKANVRWVTGKSVNSALKDCCPGMRDRH